MRYLSLGCLSACLGACTGTIYPEDVNEDENSGIELDSGQPEESGNQSEDAGDQAADDGSDESQVAADDGGDELEVDAAADDGDDELQMDASDDGGDIEPTCPPAPVFPGATWESIGNPECAGWPASALQEVKNRLAHLHSTAFMAVTNGRVLVEYGDVETVSYIASVRKSVLSMMVGIFVERGVIDLEKTLLELGIDDIGGLLDIEKQATIRNLLMSRSGVYHPAANGGDDSANAPPRGSKVPGEYFLYNNWDFNALGTIFEQETAQNIYDALLAEITLPVGMVDFDRSRHVRTGDSSKSIHLAYHMYFSTRDMARLGYLMLQNGQWDGTPIVPPDWIELATLSHTTTSGLGFGYCWWIFGTSHGDRYADGYTGIGYGGQFITVLPQVNLAIAHKNVSGRVSRDDFLDVVDILVESYCGGPCPGAVP